MTNVNPDAVTFFAFYAGILLTILAMQAIGLAIGAAFLPTGEPRMDVNHTRICACGFVLIVAKLTIIYLLCAHAEAAFTFSICLVTFFFGYGGLFVSMEHMGCEAVLCTFSVNCFQLIMYWVCLELFVCRWLAELRHINILYVCTSRHSATL